MRDLDHEITTILVLDNCEDVALERALRWATSRNHLLTILIGRRARDWPGVSRLEIERLEDPEASKLLAAVVPNLPSLQATWVNRLMGGLPGLAIYAAGELLANKNMTGFASDPTLFSRTLGRLLRERVLVNSTAEEQRALHVVSLLTQIGIKDSASHELDAVCRGLGYEVSAIRSALPALASKRLIVERGRFVEVIPPLLAETLAAEAIIGRPLLFPALLVTLEPGARLRLLARLRNVAGSDEVDRALQSIFAPAGWFPDLDSLLARAEEFHSLVAGYPAGASACLHRLLRAHPASTLREKVAGKARREIVWALSDLSLRRDTFQEAAEVLLYLAEAENEEWGNNAKGLFRDLFHPFHPEVACPLPERLQFLKQAARSDSAEKRRLVALAAGHGASTGGSFHLHHPEGAHLPELPGRPTTYAELRTYFRGLLDILSELSRDVDPGVRTEARTRVTSRCRTFVRLGISDEKRLVEDTFGLLREFADQAKEVKVVTDIRSQLEMLLEDIESTRRKAPEQSGFTESLEQIRLTALGLLMELSDESFQVRLKRWAGPHSWQDRRADFSVSEGGLRVSQAVLQALADEALQEPKLLDDSVLDWLLGQEAQHAADLFTRLGEGDAAHVWRDRLVERLGLPRGLEGFGWYVCGWARRDRSEAEEYLDRLLGADPESAEGVLAATLRMGPSRAGVGRILRLRDTQKLQQDLLIGQLAWGWTHSLPPGDFTRLVLGLDDGSWESGLALLDVLAYRRWKTGHLPDEVRPFLVDLLGRTGSTKTDQQAHSWDRLAAYLAEVDSEAALGLIEHLARQESSEKGRAVFDFLEEHASTWKVLSGLNRPALIQRLLRISIASEDVPFWVHWCSRHLIDPSQDEQTLLDFARSNGEVGALAVTDVLDSSKPGFWELIRNIVANFGDSERVIGRVETCVYHAEGWGGLAPVFEEKREQLARLAQDSDARVSRWAHRMAQELAGDVRREKRRDQEEFLWDYDVKRPELLEILQDRQSPDRLWAIRRILLHAPPEEAIRLLTVAEIREALPDLDLPDRVRRIWEAYVAHWSHSG